MPPWQLAAGLIVFGALMGIVGARPAIERPELARLPGQAQALGEVLGPLAGVAVYLLGGATALFAVAALASIALAIALTIPPHSHRLRHPTLRHLTLLTPMRALIQRVTTASVAVDGQTVGAIERGFLVLLGVTHDDGEAEAVWLARKVAGLRLFEDDAGKFNRSLHDVGGAVLVVSQFTLYGDARKGRRPSFVEAARPEQAEPLCKRFAEALRAEGLPVETGVFGAMMAVALVNDGPVTLWLDTAMLTHRDCKLFSAESTASISRDPVCSRTARTCSAKFKAK